VSGVVLASIAFPRTQNREQVSVHVDTTGAAAGKSSSTEALRRFAALLLCFGWLTLTRSASAAEAETSVRNAAEALIVGSSSVHQAFGRVLVRALTGYGYRVRRKAVTSAGLARPDFRDMNAIVEDLPISRDTALVFVYLGMNDAQSMWLHPRERQASGRRWLAWGNTRWSSVYERRVTRFVERMCARGASRVVVLLPVDVARPRLQRRLHRIRKLQARGAAASSCGEAIRTGGDAGRFVRGGSSLRSRDGFHMTPKGARVVWNRIRNRALRRRTSRAER
jgi:hypothetical protein